MGVNVTYGYTGDFDRAQIIKVAGNARGMFEGTPGLRFTAFTFSEEQQRAANFHIWDSAETARSLFTDELPERVTGLYGAAPAIEFAEIAGIAVTLSDREDQG